MDGVRVVFGVLGEGQSFAEGCLRAGAKPALDVAGLMWLHGGIGYCTSEQAFNETRASATKVSGPMHATCSTHKQATQ